MNMKNNWILISAIVLLVISITFWIITIFVIKNGKKEISNTDCNEIVYYEDSEKNTYEIIDIIYAQDKSYEILIVIRDIDTGSVKVTIPSYFNLNFTLKNKENI